MQARDLEGDDGVELGNEDLGRGLFVVDEGPTIRGSPVLGQVEDDLSPHHALVSALTPGRIRI
eukprot:2466856-Rhodomonas_salina.3